MSSSSPLQIQFQPHLQTSIPSTAATITGPADMNPAQTQAAMQMRQAGMPQGTMPQAPVMAGLTPQQMQMLQFQAAQAQSAQFSGQMMNGNPAQLVANGGRVLSKLFTIIVQTVTDNFLSFSFRPRWYSCSSKSADLFTASSSCPGRSSRSSCSSCSGCASTSSSASRATGRSSSSKP